MEALEICFIEIHPKAQKKGQILSDSSLNCDLVRFLRRAYNISFPILSIVNDIDLTNDLDISALSAWESGSMYLPIKFSLIPFCVQASL